MWALWFSFWPTPVQADLEMLSNVHWNIGVSDFLFTDFADALLEAFRTWGSRGAVAETTCEENQTMPANVGQFHFYVFMFAYFRGFGLLRLLEVTPTWERFRPVLRSFACRSLLGIVPAWLRHRPIGVHRTSSSAHLQTVVLVKVCLCCVAFAL